MNRTITSSMCALAITAVTLPSARAAAPNLCVPATNKAPQWWNPNLGATQKEARWAGATTRSLTQGPRAASVRSLWKPTQETVYFEMRVEGDVSVDAGHDVVFVALSDDTGTQPELFIRFDALQGCSNVSDCDGAGAALAGAAVQYSAASTQGTSTSWSPLSSVNPSVDFTVEHPWAVVDDSGAVPIWTLSFALHVPVDGAGEIRPDLRIYSDVIVHDPGYTSGTDYELPVLCTPSSITSNDCTIYGAPGAEAPYDLPLGNMVASWPRLRSDCPTLAVLSL
jgi:hypothetical protein